MFEFLFKYPAALFSKGTLLLAGPWPAWTLLLAVALASAALAIPTLRRWPAAPRSRRAQLLALWLLQSAAAALILLLFWEPAISVAALKPQQNIIAIVLDDSRSMALADTGPARQQQALQVLDSGLLKSLESRFQVRFYRLAAGIERIHDPHALCATGPATQIGKGLHQLADEAATLPIGAIVLLSDGADNSGGIDLDTLAELRRHHIPVHTIGFGRETLTKDVELDNFDVPARALEDSRLQAQIAIRQNGFSGAHARLTLTAAGATLATRDLVLSDAAQQTASLEFNAGKAGVRTLEVRLQPLPGEQNAANNHLTRVLSVDNTTRRILYIEGEPRWEYKFIRRAIDDDPALHIVSMLRTTQNKIYRQGLANPTELADGFPTKPEDLFEYQGLILGSIESSFFTPGQQQMIKDFVDRRGAGLLFLAGRSSLSDGGFGILPFAELLPVALPTRKNTFDRVMVPAELTDAGKQSLICRIEDDPEKSVQHWEVLPYLANFQDPGTPKPGAVVLARVNANGNHPPLLITQNYGRGRTAVFATAGSWRWRMQQPLGDNSQETFWRQLLRWQAGATPGRVVASVPNATLEDDGRIQLRAEVRDPNYFPASDADVQADVISPDGSSQVVPMRPDPLTPGLYAADWDAPKPGSYLAEVSATRANAHAAPTSLGHDVVTFQRENGVAENFHREQNRDLLAKLSEDTGGRYYTPASAPHLAQEISYSEAGITGREIKELWDMPAVFLLLIGLRAAEWLLRRRWGLI